ncbi:ATP-dependent helicase [Hugenholtzia roseola]|uniref:ATP-dependent helicase n=1 Tax=Hugenholtzia roseola TaxID=1002 RepID=UPI000479870B|nr:UvrD-helicase domain-containing protein [Hugenholtzia roseola]
MSNPEKLLQQLNDKQRQAVTQTEGATLIIAGAGSGKTRVLTYRIAYLLALGVEPWQILALTFTNKAAKEMRERIETLVGTEARNLWMGTFHSIFARILRYEGHKLGYQSNFTIYDTDDSKSLLKNIVKELKLDDKVYNANSLLNRISSAKNSLISAKEYNLNPQFKEEDRHAQRPEMGRIYQIYTHRCFQANAMDFDDLLFQTNVLFRDHLDVLHKYQHKFRYILVDEFQDTNLSQYYIIRKLSAVHLNICVVGDDAQSIYAFRGADIRNILNFEKDYPDLNIVKLEQNYRSTQNIVEAANKVIENNQKQIRKTVWTENYKGEKIDLFKANSDNEEGRLIASAIFEARANKKLSLSEFAILYRTNAQSRAFEEALRRLGLKYRIIGGLSFYQRKEIKDIIAYFRMATNRYDEEAFRRSINNPRRGLGDTTLNKVYLASRENAIPIFEVVKNTARYLGSNRANAGLEKYALLIETFAKIAEEKDAYEAAKFIAQQSGLMKALFEDSTVEGRSRYENVQELLNATKEFVDNPENEEKTLAFFLQSVSLITSGDEAKDDEPAVTMMTIHAAKGLEFSQVFVVGMEEDLFPSGRMIGSRAELEEERRLFYVAITRAKEKLTLSYALTRYYFGSLKPCEPSRFLFEIDPALLNLSNPSRVLNQGDNFGNTHYKPQTPAYKSDKTAAKPTSPAASSTHKEIRLSPPSIPSVGSSPNAHVHKPSEDFKANPSHQIEAGQRVEHAKFGYGNVLRLENAQGGKRAIIAFDKVGEKTLILSFAKLRIVE